MLFAISQEPAPIVHAILFVQGCLIVAAMSILGASWVGRHTHRILGVPITVWRDAVVLRVLAFLMLFVGDVLIVNAQPPYWMAPDSPGSITEFISHLSNWDGRWYIGIGEMGYATLAQEGIIDLQGKWCASEVEPNPRWEATAPEQWKHYGAYHFFPLFPMLLRLLFRLPLSSPLVALIFSNILFVACVSGLYRLAEKHGDRVAADSVRLYCLMPAAVFTFGAFSEPLLV